MVDHTFTCGVPSQQHLYYHHDGEKEMCYSMHLIDVICDLIVTIMVTQKISLQVHYLHMYTCGLFVTITVISQLIRILLAHINIVSLSPSWLTYRDSTLHALEYF